MILHVRAHLNHDYIKIGIIINTNSPFLGYCRPEHHTYYDSTGSWSIGNDARMYTVLLPEGTLLGDDGPLCRICGKVEAKIYMPDLPARKITYRIQLLRKHEKHCKGKVRSKIIIQ